MLAINSLISSACANALKQLTIRAFPCFFIILSAAVSFKNSDIVGMPDHPTPSSRGYLKSHYPNKKKIIQELSNFFADIKKNYKSIMRELEKENKKLPIDIPDPSFKGPF